MLHNDRTLRRTLKLPRTNIETDSFIAVQLLQQKKALNFDSLKYMAETVEGSFAFTVLDGGDYLYFVKGDNPLCIYHYPKLGHYLYASTEQVLTDALLLMPWLMSGIERVSIDNGEFLMIGSKGEQQRAAFQFDDPSSSFGFGYWGWPRRRTSGQERSDYIRTLKAVAGVYGISPDQIDQFLNEGFETEEIEDYL